MKSVLLITALYAFASFTSIAADSAAAFGGIGAQLDKNGDHIVLKSILKGSSAEKAGIPPGTVLVSVDGKVLKGLSLEDATRLIRGPVGTNATVVAIPPGSPVTKNYVLPRAIVQMLSFDNIVGTYKFSDDPGSTVIITQIDPIQFKVSCLKQHWSGIGLASRENLNIKGVYLFEDHPDIVTVLRKNGSYFRIDLDVNGLNFHTFNASVNLSEGRKLVFDRETKHFLLKQ